MRDILKDLQDGQAQADPMRSAQSAMKAPLPKRFYTDAVAAAAPEGHQVLLDGKSVRTPARHLLAVPSRALAEQLAAEFAAQETHINPMTMPMLRLVNTALDGVGGNEQAIKEDIQRFAGSDLLCYRAEGPQGLVDRQAEHWDAVLDWVRSRLGVQFVLAEGVMHVAQPRVAISAIGTWLAPVESPLRLAALHSLTTLTGSALLAIAHADGFLDADAMWTAAHIDEDWNISQWGEDAEATARRRFRETEMRAASAVLAETA